MRFPVGVWPPGAPTTSAPVAVNYQTPATDVTARRERMMWGGSVAKLCVISKQAHYTATRTGSQEGQFAFKCINENNARKRRACLRYRPLLDFTVCPDFLSFSRTCASAVL